MKKMYSNYKKIKNHTFNCETPRNSTALARKKCEELRFPE